MKIFNRKKHHKATGLPYKKLIVLVDRTGSVKEVEFIENKHCPEKAITDKEGERYIEWRGVLQPYFTWPSQILFDASDYIAWCYKKDYFKSNTKWIKFNPVEEESVHDRVKKFFSKQVNRLRKNA